MIRRAIGIDPDADGFIVVMDENYIVKEEYKMPRIKGTTRKIIDWTLFKELLRDILSNAEDDGISMSEIKTYLEEPLAFPGQNVVAVAKQWENFGTIQGFVVSKNIKYERARAKVWQTMMLAGTPASENTKVRALMICQREWPGVQFLTARDKQEKSKCDAYLMAKYILITSNVSERGWRAYDEQAPI